VAMPQKLQTERRYVCTLLKLLFYQHVLSRFDLKHDDERWQNKNVLICWQDEAQRFVTEADGNVDVIRQALGTTVMATQSLLSLFPPLGGKEKAEVILLNLRNRVIFGVADEKSAEITADFIGKHEVKRQDRSVSGQGTTYNYRTEEQHKIKPSVLRGLPKYTAIVRHANGHFRKTLIPPRDNQGRIAEWWLQQYAPPLYKLLVPLGLIK
jgi:type IV secretory pathway TraG/TraD family ATPase VirD4